MKNEARAGEPSICSSTIFGWLLVFYGLVLPTFLLGLYVHDYVLYVYETVGDLVEMLLVLASVAGGLIAAVAAPFRVRMCVGAGGVTRGKLWGAPCRIRWQDVREVRLRGKGGINQSRIKLFLADAKPMVVRLGAFNRVARPAVCALIAVNTSNGREVLDGLLAEAGVPAWDETAVPRLIEEACRKRPVLPRITLVFVAYVVSVGLIMLVAFALAGGSIGKLAPFAMLFVAGMVPVHVAIDLKES